MSPADLVPFFSASMGAAAALLGLLFVAVSINPEQTVGASASIERQAVADSVFTAMVDAFFVSMGGAIPGAGLGTIALLLGGITLSHTAFVAWRLWPRPFGARLAARRLTLVLLGLVIYGLQFDSGLQLVRTPTSFAAVVGQINVLFAVYGFAMVRSWQLLGARRGMISSLLGSFLAASDDEGTPDETPKAEAAPTAKDRELDGPH